MHIVALPQDKEIEISEYAAGVTSNTSDRQVT
jgi:hypothetical protein